VNFFVRIVKTGPQASRTDPKEKSWVVVREARGGGLQRCDGDRRNSANLFLGGGGAGRGKQVSVGIASRGGTESPLRGDL